VSRRLEEVLARPLRAEMLAGFVDRRAEELERLHARRPPSESIARRDVLRAAVVECLGIERLPVASAPVRSLGQIDRDAYVIEKLVFEAVPGLPVPGLLYLPRDAPDGIPAIVHPPGHWMENAKLEPELQRASAWLARSGVAVLCYDTLGQGERRRGWHQHGQLGTLLVGFTTLAVMVAEARRALDVLAARPEIDPSRLGLLGASGGAWTGIFAAAVDERVRAAAIVSIVNTHLGQIRAARGTGWDGAACLCNQLPRLCAIGSIAEIIALTAPRAVLQVNAVDDPPFPIEGARRVAAEVAALYAAADVPTAFDYAEVTGGHGLRPQARAAAVDWLVRRLAEGSPPPERPDETLLEAPYGTTYIDLGDDAATRQDFSRPARLEGECLDESVDSNGPLLALAASRAVGLRRVRESAAKEMLRDVLGPLPEPGPIRSRVENRIRLDDEHAERVSFESEDGIRLDAVFLLPATWTDEPPRVVVLLDEGGKAAALDSADAEVARSSGCALLAPDLRGTGESACAEWETATTAFMLDRDLLAQRIWDARRAVEWVWRRAVVGQQVDRGRIVLWGGDAFGLVALAAAALDERVAAAGARGLVRSLEDLIVAIPETSPMAYPYRLLERLDVGDVEALVRPRPTARDDLGELLRIIQ
jgi:cephalosporin-C deacetylase-like acetyl esterase